MFCQNSPLWPVHLGWPCTAWLIASLSYARLWSMWPFWLVYCYYGPDAGKDWGQEEKGATEDEHHQLYGHEFEQAPGDSEGQGRLVCCSPCGYKELDMTEWLNNNNKLITKKEPNAANNQWVNLEVDLSPAEPSDKTTDVELIYRGLERDHKTEYSVQLCLYSWLIEIVRYKCVCF